MSTAVALHQPRLAPLTTESLRAVMVRRGHIIRSLRAKLYQLANANVRLDQDLDEANAYITELENRLDEARTDAEQLREQIHGGQQAPGVAGGATC